MASPPWRARCGKSPRCIAPPEVSPAIRLALYLASVFGAAAGSTYLPLWFADQGLTPAAIGQVLGLASLFRVLTGPAWGTVADRLGRRRPVMVAAAATAAFKSLAFIPAYGFLPILIVAAIQRAINPRLMASTGRDVTARAASS